jgi:hypothetical protein
LKSLVRQLNEYLKQTGSKYYLNVQEAGADGEDIFIGILRRDAGNVGNYYLGHL